MYEHIKELITLLSISLYQKDTENNLVPYGEHISFTTNLFS